MKYYLLSLALLSCAVFRSVTPEDRAKAYEADAKATAFKCSTYKFDRAMSLVPDVPAMTKLCQ